MAKEDAMDVDLGCIYHANKDHWLAGIKQYMKEISHLHKKKIILFTVSNINLEKNIIQNACVIDGHTERLAQTKIPSLIYNFVAHTKPSSIKTIRQLRMLTDIVVINPVNRFYQHILFEMINSIIKTKGIILPYANISRSSVEKFAKKYDDFFLLPQRTSRKYRMISIKKVSFGSYGDDENFEIVFENMKYMVTTADLYLEIIKNIKHKKYILIKDPAPVIWNHSPLEVRVYIQKEITGKWTMVDWIAKKELLSQNSFYDKTSDNLSEVLLELFPDKMTVIKKRIHHAALDISVLLDYYIPNIGSCLIDFIFDANGNPYVIRIDGFEQDNYLYELDEGSVWKDYIKNAALYLIYLSNDK